MDILPDIIDNTNLRFLKVDDKYIMSINIKSLPDNIHFLDIMQILPTNHQYDLSMYIKRIDAIKAINEITYNIGTTISEISSINSNQRNIDIVSRAKEEAQELRKKIQTENQELYYINIIITFYSTDFNNLLKFLSEFKSKLYSKGITSETTNFRHKEFYLSNLPLYITNEELFNNICLTTDALSNLFMFCANNITDIKGVNIGFTSKDNRICKLDIFSEKYENSNMCIFGSSGSGKSYFIKLFCIRNYIQSRRQIILDIEGEYNALCKKLDGAVLFNDSYINILEITENDFERFGENFLNEKIENVVSFISDLANIDKEYYKKKIKQLYLDFNITEDKNSIISFNSSKEVDLSEKIISSELFPSLEDLMAKIGNMNEKAILRKLINNELKFFSKRTTQNINTNFFVINTQEIISYPKLITAILKSIMDFLNYNFGKKQETIIYIDELWKYASENIIINEIFNMYKTIRKRNASIISITQDIGDFFEYKNGLYANSILNNCNFKLFFKTEYKETNNYINMVDKDELKHLLKGEAVLAIGSSTLKFKVKANDFERELIHENDNSSR